MQRFSLLLVFNLLLSGAAPAMDLSLTPSTPHCGFPAVKAASPVAAKQRLDQSTAVQGTKNISWAWLGSPTIRYPHRSFGSFNHAGSVHVLLRNTLGELIQLDYILPVDRVFEDLLPRLIDLDGDGQDELVLVESNALTGAALVVLGIQRGLDQLPAIKELARGPNSGRPFRWLNPVGAADFDGDGKLDLAAVITPHIGGVLTLYRYQPPHLHAFASVTDVSNHKMGSTEQRMGVVVPPAGQQIYPTVIIPDMGLKALYALRRTKHNTWQEIDKLKTLPASVVSLLLMKNGACAQLSDGSWWAVGLMQ
jgi:hypothetical protein